MNGTKPIVKEPASNKISEDLKIGTGKTLFVDGGTLDLTNGNVNGFEDIISNQTLKTTLAGTEEILINDAGTPKKTTAQDIADLGGGGPSGGGVTISDTAPLTPAAGDLWWDSSIGVLFLYYDDGASQQWVEAGGNGASTIIQTKTYVDTTNRSISSGTLASTGFESTLTSNLASPSSRVRITVHMTVGQSSAAACFFSLASWDGATQTDLTPSGVTALASCTPSSNTDLRRITFTFEHTPGTVSPLTYRVTAYSGSGVGTIYLGRRGLDTFVDVAQQMIIEEIAP